MWTYDLAREQAPTLDHLRRLCDVSLESGYTALGLYMEHRFAYPSIPWAHGKAAVTPEMVRRLVEEFPQLEIVPFLNLLGHMEGLIYSEGGSELAEEPFKGMQACPSKPAVVELAHTIIRDTLQLFTSNLIHIGADETFQLGACPLCKARIAEFEVAHPGADGKAMLFGDHFGPLAQMVLDAGRRPGIWGDMFIEHPSALDRIPKETVIFEWQYFNGPEETARRFLDAGYDTVFCPTLLTYSAPWLHLPESERNVLEHAEAAERLGAYGVCMTSWECELFGSYETLLPIVKAGGKILQGGAGDSPFLRAFLHESETFEDWAMLMGVELQKCGPLFAFSSIRSSLKCRFLLYSNPFLLWLHHRDALCGEEGDQALEILDRAISVAPNAGARGVSEFVRIAIEFVRHVEEARKAYAALHPGEAVAALSPARAGFDDLTKIAKANYLRIGGSLADIERCRVAKEHVERVMLRIKSYGDGSLGYLPSFETITHPKFMPHDQGNWWLINDWANE